MSSSSGEEDDDSDEEEIEEDIRPKTVDFTHILNSLQPQFVSTDTAPRHTFSS